MPGTTLRAALELLRARGLEANNRGWLCSDVREMKSAIRSGISQSPTIPGTPTLQGPSQPHSSLQLARTLLGQRSCFRPFIFLFDLLVNTLGFVRFLEVLVELGQFKLRRHLADSQGRLVDQLFVEINRLCVLLLCAVDGGKGKLGESRKIAIGCVGHLLQVALSRGMVSTLGRS